MSGNAVYFDFHTHILPGADHGSTGAADTITEMSELCDLGAGIAVATPHFYPTRTNVDKFRRVRAAAANEFEKYAARSGAPHASAPRWLCASTLNACPSLTSFA